MFVGAFQTEERNLPLVKNIKEKPVDLTERIVINYFIKRSNFKQKLLSIGDNLEHNTMFLSRKLYPIKENFMTLRFLRKV